MNLNQCLYIIEENLGYPLNELSPLKIKAILFFTQIDYYTINGKRLFDNDIRCYYHTIEIEGFPYPVVVETTELEDDDLAIDILTSFTQFFEDLDDDEIIHYFYQSKAFLRANLAKGHRLTNKLLQEYHDVYAHVPLVEEGDRHTIIDEVEPHYDLVNELKNDRLVRN